MLLSGDSSSVARQRDVQVEQTMRRPWFTGNKCNANWLLRCSRLFGPAAQPVIVPGGRYCSTVDVETNQAGPTISILHGAAALSKLVVT